MALTAHQILRTRDALRAAWKAAHPDTEAAEWWADNQALIGVLLHDVLSVDHMPVPASDADADVTISHTPADGTIATFARDADIATIIKRFGFLWVRSLGIWRRQGSVGTPVPTLGLRAIKEYLNDGGFKVAFEIETGTRAEAREAKAEYLRARAEMYEARAARRTAASTTAYQRARGALEGHTGEPIKVGHHSEGRHRRDIARHDTAMRASITEQKRAEHAEYRAGGREAAAERVERELSRVERDQRIADITAAIRSGIRKATGAIKYSEQIARFTDRNVVLFIGASATALETPYGRGPSFGSVEYGTAATPEEAAQAVYARLREISPPRAADADYAGHAKKNAKKALGAIKIGTDYFGSFILGYGRLNARNEPSYVAFLSMPTAGGYVLRLRGFGGEDGPVIARATGMPAEALAALAAVAKDWLVRRGELAVAEEDAGAAYYRARGVDLNETRWRKDAVKRDIKDHEATRPSVE